MHSSYSRWSGVLKSTSSMTKMTVEPVHRHSCANSSALPVQLVCGWPDVPCSGSGSPASGALPPKTTRKQPGEPPKIDLQGVIVVDVTTPHRPPLHPYPCCASTTQLQSDPTGERDRDQPGALRYATRPASAAQRGGAIICRRPGCLSRVTGGRLSFRTDRCLATIDRILGMNSGVGFIFLPVCRVLICSAYPLTYLVLDL